jgi:hypothetical protein
MKLFKGNRTQEEPDPLVSADPPAGRVVPSQLVHPIYLDVPMLVSFLAALEGGVAFEGQQTTRQALTTAGEREGSGRVALPVGLSMLIGLDMTGRIKSATQDEAGEEVVAIRRHTEASLFNLLRSRLEADDAVVMLDSPAQLDDLEVGALVAMSGEVVGNPLAELVRMIARVLPLFGTDVEKLMEGPSKPRRQGGRSQAPQEQLDAESLEGLRYFVQFGAELLSTAVRDVVMHSPSGLSAVLTLSSEFLSDQAEEYLRGSRLQVLGKVSEVVAASDQSINLMRRGTMGFVEKDEVRQLVKTTVEALESPLVVSLADPIVEAPAVQVLPLAIYV